MLVFSFCIFDTRLEIRSIYRVFLSLQIKPPKKSQPKRARTSDNANVQTKRRRLRGSATQVLTQPVPPPPIPPTAQDPPTLPSSQDRSAVVDFPPSLLDQLVSRVSEEVSKRLAANNADVRPQLPASIASNAVTLGCTLGEGTTEVPIRDESGETSHAVPVLQGAVSQLQGQLSGDVSFQLNTLPTKMFTSSSLPIDARVSTKLRAKILAHEFVDFGALATNPILENKYQVVVQNASGGQTPSLALEPVAKSKKILTIESWTSSFLVSLGFILVSSLLRPPPS